jgi:undecaprenyl-diphosphatase
MTESGDRIPGLHPVLAHRPRRYRTLLGWLLFALAASACTASRAGGPFGIDHLVGYDNAGIWRRGNQTALLDAMIAAEAACGIWEGGETRAGRACWQSIDASLISAVSTETLKRVFRRERPSDASSPDQWFRSGNARSFPSGEASATQAIVTPLLLEYGADHPSVYALEVLPLYDAIARVKVRAHWQSDVLAGLAIGGAAGWYAHSRDRSLVLGVLPHGFTVGMKGRF